MHVIYCPINRGVDPDVNTQSHLKVSAAGTRNKKKTCKKVRITFTQ